MLLAEVTYVQEATDFAAVFINPGCGFFLRGGGVDCTSPWGYATPEFTTVFFHLRIPLFFSTSPLSWASEVFFQWSVLLPPPGLQAV